MEIHGIAHKRVALTLQNRFGHALGALAPAVMGRVITPLANWFFCPTTPQTVSG